MGKLLWYVFVWPFRTIQQRWGTRWATVSYVAAFFVFVMLVGSLGGSDTPASSVAEPDAAAAADDSATVSPEAADEDVTAQQAPSEPQIDTAAIERQAVRTLAAIDRMARGHYFKALPKDVRSSYRALDRLLGSQIKIGVHESEAAEQRIGDLRDALDSGKVHHAVKRKKAKERAAREKKRREAQAAATAAAEAAAAEEQTSNCDANYSGCLDPNASDYDCEGGSGDGPLYTGQVEIRGSDPHGLDADGDGIGCEPY